MLCAACGREYSERSPVVAVWVQDPTTGKRVHRECLSGGLIIRHPVAPARDARHLREVTPPKARDMPEP